MKIMIVGTGYVGLVTGTCFAEMGNEVICVDTDLNKINSLKKGKITIFEPGLENYFLKNIKNNRLSFSSDIGDFIDEVSVIFLALPTPPGEDGSADLKFVLGVAEHIGKIIKGYKVIVNKSTVPVGTADKVRATIAKNYNGEYDVVSNPEFLREGVAVEDFMKPERIVIGTRSEKAKKILTDLYAPFVKQGNPILIMDEYSSELTKYAANSFLATKISFMNEIAKICDLLGGDVDLVRKGIGSDSRIGERFLFPGIGYGGSCFPKDVKALIKSSDEVNYNFQILKAVELVNTNQKFELVKKIKDYFQDNLKGKHFAIWGLSFKPNTDDIREAPSLVIIDSLISLGCTITAYDPESMLNVKNDYGNRILFKSNKYEAVDGADALIIATEWDEFKTPDFNLLSKKLSNKLIFDGRNLYNVSKMIDLGYNYFSIGRDNIK